MHIVQQAARLSDTLAGCNASGMASKLASKVSAELAFARHQLATYHMGRLKGGETSVNPCYDVERKDGYQ
jgi:hypothetical protein